MAYKAVEGFLFASPLTHHLFSSHQRVILYPTLSELDTAESISHLGLEVGEACRAPLARRCQL